MRLDVTSTAFKADPFPYLAELRRTAPVLPVRLPDRRSGFLVTRYDDVAAVLADDRFVKNPHNALTPQQLRRQPWLPPILRPLLWNMLDQDPPDHTRLRALVSKAFVPRLVDRLHDRIEGLAEDLVEGIVRRGRNGTGTCDLIADFALPIPTTVIAELLGIPVEDRHRFHRCSQAVVASSASRWGNLRMLPALWSFLRYVRRLVAERRTAFQNGREDRDDLIGALLRAEEGGRRLDDDELVAMIFLLLVAGHETTVNLIGTGMLELSERPDQWERLRNAPELADSAVEELLRFTCPVDSATERYAAEDVEVGGVPIPRGALVLASIASANRDETRFAQPDRLDLARTPNRHLSFGLGRHYCLGAPLARLEARLAFGVLARRFAELQTAVPRTALAWRPGLALRGLRKLPMTWRTNTEAGCPMPQPPPSLATSSAHRPRIGVAPVGASPTGVAQRQEV